MELDGISRNSGLRRTRRKKNYTGTILCVVAAVLFLSTAFNILGFLTNTIYGIFGWYAYVGFLAMFGIGLLIGMRKKITVNRRFALCGGLMIFALFTAVHLAFTHTQFRVDAGVSFGKYLTSGFSPGGRTPGGLIFALPSFVLHSVCQLPGSFILLAVLFVISGSLVTTHIVAAHGEKAAVTLAESQFEIENTEKAEKKKAAADYKKKSKELHDTLEAKYQEMLQKQSAKRVAAGKSALGLTTPPPATPAGAIYDSPVALDGFHPDPMSAPDQINIMSTEAARKFNAGLGQTFGQQEAFSQQQAFGQPQGFGGGFGQPQSFGAEQGFAQQQGAVFNQGGTGAFGEQQGFGQSGFSQSFGAEADEDDEEVNQDRINRRLERARQRMGGSLDDRINARGEGARRGGLQPAGEQMTMEVKQPKTYKPRQYIKPPISLIRSESTNLDVFHQDALEKQKLLDAKLQELGVNAKVVGFTVAPAVTRFEIQLSTGTRVAQVEQLSKDISYVLGSTSIRLELVEGKNAIGVEVPNKSVGLVSVRDILASTDFLGHKGPLPIAIGKNLNDDVVVGDISTMPHLLVAGSTGSGKSVCLNTLLVSLLYRAHPDEVKLLLVDMKRVELNTYNGGPHMLIPSAIKELQQVLNALKWMEHEMRRRYDVLEAAGVPNIGLYHSMPAYAQGTLERMPYIVMVIDEAADLLTRARKEAEASIQSLSALARACGIHIVLATQRPSVDIITGVIKTNFTVRIAFKVSSRGDSVTIISDTGAEKLVGRGDMLFVKEGKSQRVQCAFIELEEARKVMNFIRENNATDFDPELENIILNGLPDPSASGVGGGSAAQGFGDADFVRGKAGMDPLFVQILKWAVREDNTTRTISISNVQRNFNIGFTRAGRIIDQLAEAGYVSSGGGTKARQVLVTQYDVDEAYGQ
jgi:DNA segregation ATPase FtsK/SpoIIIE-like protein